MPDTPNTLFIQIYTNVARHRKTKQLARKLSLTIRDTTGMLVMLWSWAIEETSNGTIEGDAAAIVADACAWDGDPDDLLRALLEVAYLDRHDDIVAVHEWGFYGGKVLQQRDRNRQRQRDHRERSREGHGNGYVTVTEAEMTNRDSTAENNDPGSRNGYVTVSRQERGDAAIGDDQNRDSTAENRDRDRRNGYVTGKSRVYESRVDERRVDKDRPTNAGMGVSGVPRTQGPYPPLGPVGRSDDEDLILSILKERPDWPRDRGGNTTRELRDILAKNSGVDFVKVAHALKQTTLRSRPANLLTFRKFCEAAKRELTEPRITGNPNGKAKGPYRDKAQVPVPPGGYAVDLNAEHDEEE